MAIYVLLNDTNFSGAKLRAGKQINDVHFDIALLEAAGAQLIPFDPVSASIGALFGKMQLRGAGGNLDVGQPIPLAGGGLGRNSTGGAPSFLRADTWFIDGTNGRDSNGGTAEFVPLQTWAELQRRWGIWTTVSPSLSTLVVQILGPSLPDPITFRNFIDKNVTVYIKGQKQVLATGTTVSVIDRDRVNNVPFQIEAPIVWADYLGKAVHITSGPAEGSYAWIARDMGSDFAHMSTWGEFNFTGDDGAVFPAAAPIGGETFEILDFTEVILGDMTFGSNEAEVFNPGVGGFILDYIHVKNQFVAPMPNSINLGHPGIAHSIFDNQGINSYDTNFGNCCFNGSTIFQEGVKTSANVNMFIFSGLFRAVEEFTFNGIDARMCKILVFGDPTFVGLFEAAQTDIFMWKGSVQLGPVSFWDTFHGLQNNNSWFFWEPFDFINGEFGYPPLWGNGNFGLVGMVDGATYSMNQFNFGTDPPLPSIEMVNGAGGAAIAARNGIFGAGVDLEIVAHTWDETSGPPAGFTIAHPTEWARFAIDRGNLVGDGFQAFSQDYDGFVLTKANAVWPESGCRFTRNMGVVL